MKITFFTIIAFSFLLILYQTVYAQNPSLNITKLIEDKYSKELSLDPERSVKEFLVKVEYESPNTVVLYGNLLTSNVTGYYFNSGLWSAMDLLKTQYGFKLAQIIPYGQGTMANPNLVYIVMTK
jgi:hypothetical protein